MTRWAKSDILHRRKAPSWSAERVLQLFNRLGLFELPMPLCARIRSTELFVGFCHFQLHLVKYRLFGALAILNKSELSN